MKNQVKDNKHVNDEVKAEVKVYMLDESKFAEDEANVILAKTGELQTVALDNLKKSLFKDFSTFILKSNNPALALLDSPLHYTASLSEGGAVLYNPATSIKMTIRQALDSTGQKIHDNLRDMIFSALQDSISDEDKPSNNELFSGFIALANYIAPGIKMTRANMKACLYTILKRPALNIRPVANSAIDKAITSTLSSARKNIAPHVQKAGKGKIEAQVEVKADEVKADEVKAENSAA